LVEVGERYFGKTGEDYHTLEDVGIVFEVLEVSGSFARARVWDSRVGSSFGDTHFYRGVILVNLGAFSSIQEWSRDPRNYGGPAIPREEREPTQAKPLTLREVKEIARKRRSG